MSVRVFEIIGLLRAILDNLSLVCRTGAVGGEVLCEICLIPVPVSAMTGLECGHDFCTHCWTEYLTTKIMDEGMGQRIACAAHRCDILVDDMTVM